MVATVAQAVFAGILIGNPANRRVQVEVSYGLCHLLYNIYIYTRLYFNTVIVMQLNEDTPNLNELVLLRALAIRDAPEKYGGFSGDVDVFLRGVGWSHKAWDDWVSIFRVARKSDVWDNIARMESMQMQKKLFRLYAIRSFSDQKSRCCVHETTASLLERNDPNLHEVVLRRALSVLNTTEEYGGYDGSMPWFLSGIDWSQQDWDIWIAMTKMPRWDEFARDESMYMQTEVYRLCMLRKHGISIDTPTQSAVARVLSTQHGKKTPNYL